MSLNEYKIVVYAIVGLILIVALVIFLWWPGDCRRRELNPKEDTLPDEPDE